MNLNLFFIHVSRLAVGIGIAAATAGEQSDSRQMEKVRADITKNIGTGESKRAWQYIVIHHSATDSGSLESIHRDHRSRRDRNGRPWLGIGYHFVIGNGTGMTDGQISPTFRWKQQLHGAHSGSLPHNSHGIGICLIGNFEELEPTSAQTTGVTELIRQLATRYNIPAKNIIGHRNVRATACPGRHFPMKDVIEKSVGSIARSNPNFPLTSHSGQFSRH